MKKGIFILALAIIGALTVLNTACEITPDEACEEDLFCDNTKEVTVCCTDGTDCHWSYLGVNYPDTDAGLHDLLLALDCDSTKSGSEKDNSCDLADELRALLEEARKLSSK